MSDFTQKHTIYTVLQWPQPWKLDLDASFSNLLTKVWKQNQAETLCLFSCELRIPPSRRQIWAMSRSQSVLFAICNSQFTRMSMTMMQKPHKDSRTHKTFMRKLSDGSTKRSKRMPLRGVLMPLFTFMSKTSGSICPRLSANLLFLTMMPSRQTCWRN